MTSYSHVGINVVARPPSRPVGAGRVRTVWRLETLADLPLVAGSTIDLTGVSRDMSVTATVTGPRTIAMECTCAEELADPYRLGSAGLAWRVIDENYARLWMIGDSPRAHHTPFMRQRREMAGRLTPPARNLWLWLSMTRAEPLFAAVAAQ